MRTVSGSCLCQKVQFDILNQPLSNGICYCNQCQKSGGAYGSPLIVLHKNQFQCSIENLSAVKSISERGATVTRNFCSSCGSHIFSQISDVPDFITVKAVTLDSFKSFKPEYLVWTESAVDSCTFPEGVPRFLKSAPFEILMGFK